MYKPISDVVQNPEIVYGQQYISLMARRGKIDAFKESNSWHTTKKAVELYTRIKLAI